MQHISMELVMGLYSKGSFLFLKIHIKTFDKIYHWPDETLEVV